MATAMIASTLAGLAGRAWIEKPLLYRLRGGRARPVLQVTAI
jgi:hypothetical protein